MTTEELLAHVDALEARIARLEAGLREAEQDMTCGVRIADDAHYCPNCNNSSYDARARIRAALAGSKGGGDETTSN